jgi:hypothetical protein
MMSLYRFEICVPLSASEVRARVQSLLSQVEQGRPWRFRTTTKEFRFRQEPADPEDVTDFSPQVHGRVREQPTGCTVQVSMSLHPLVAVFMAVWLSLTGGAALWQLLAEKRTDSALGAGLMFALGLLATFLAFYPSARSIRKRLIDVLTRAQ